MPTTAELSENSRQGLRPPKPASHRGWTEANSNTASALQPWLRRNHVGPRCSGKQRDDASGLDYFGARYYASANARWISADSVMAHRYDPPSLNKFSYVRNDPINRIDRNGKSWNCVSRPYEQRMLLPEDPFNHSWDTGWLVDGCSDIGGGGVAGDIEEIGSSGRGGGGNGREPEPSIDYCNPNDAANQRAQSYFDAHKYEAQILAKSWGVPYEIILAVGAEETTWGKEGIVLDTFNWFGLHVKNQEDVSHSQIKLVHIWRQGMAGSPPSTN
jgi:RHS repeat-associated protein